MRDLLSATLTQVSTTQLALRFLREDSTSAALELLEVDLDAGVLRLDKIAKQLDPAEREPVNSALRQIRAYRLLHPRQVEADLGAVADGKLVSGARYAEEKARKILDEID